MPTVKMMGTANYTTVGDSSVAFPSEPVKGKPLWGGCFIASGSESGNSQEAVRVVDYAMKSRRRCSSLNRRSSFARARFLARYSADGCGRLHSGTTISEHFR